MASTEPQEALASHLQDKGTTFISQLEPWILVLRVMSVLFQPLEVSPQPGRSAVKDFSPTELILLQL